MATVDSNSLQLSATTYTESIDLDIIVNLVPRHIENAQVTDFELVDKVYTGNALILTIEYDASCLTKPPQQLDFADCSKLCNYDFYAGCRNNLIYLGKPHRVYYDEASDTYFLMLTSGAIFAYKHALFHPFYKTKVYNIPNINAPDYIWIVSTCSKELSFLTYVKIDKINDKPLSEWQGIYVDVREQFIPLYPQEMNYLNPLLLQIHFVNLSRVIQIDFRNFANLNPNDFLLFLSRDLIKLFPIPYNMQQNDLTRRIDIYFTFTIKRDYPIDYYPERLQDYLLNYSNYGPFTIKYSGYIDARP